MHLYFSFKMIPHHEFSLKKITIFFCCSCFCFFFSFCLFLGYRHYLLYQVWFYLLNGLDFIGNIKNTLLASRGWLLFSSHSHPAVLCFLYMERELLGLEVKNVWLFVSFNIGLRLTNVKDTSFFLFFFFVTRNDM